MSLVNAGSSEAWVLLPWSILYAILERKRCFCSVDQDLLKPRSTDEASSHTCTPRCPRARARHMQSPGACTSTSTMKRWRMISGPIEVSMLARSLFLPRGAKESTPAFPSDVPAARSPVRSLPITHAFPLIIADADSTSLPFQL